MSQQIAPPTKADIWRMKAAPVEDLEHCTHLLTLRQAAHYLQKHRDTLRKSPAAYGGFKKGGEWRFDPKDLLARGVGYDGAPHQAPAEPGAGRTQEE